jgi:hypothetical protein
MKKLTSILPALALAAGCTVTTSQDIAPGSLGGTVSGHSWLFAAGDTNAFLSQGQSSFYAELYPASYSACGSVVPSGAHLIVSIPMAAGDYQLNLSRNMTFVDDFGNNLIATDGRIVVDQVSATHVSGGLHGTYDVDNDVSGHFDVTVCSQ